MPRPDSPNRRMLEAAARRLGPIVPDVVFVGGQVTELLITDPAAARIRPTDDVDVIVAVASRTDYQRLSTRLRQQGFREDMRPGAPLCRWRSGDEVVLDVMPTDEAILGFSNQWYPMALERCASYQLTPDLTIFVPEAPVFVATKLEAFDHRGGADYRTSHDIEDVITLVAGRESLAAEVRETDPRLRHWLSTKIGQLVEHPDAPDALAAALPDARFDGGLLTKVRQRLVDLISG